jgi:hypothetical protein
MEKRGKIGIKGQVTLFMLIGVVMAAGAFLVFHTAQIQTKMQLENKADEITQQLLKTTALEEYVTLCLKDSAEKGLILLGAQGGVIYKSQNGTTTDYVSKSLPPGRLAIPKKIDINDVAGTKVGEENIYVSYALEKPTLIMSDLGHQPVPMYPYAGYFTPQTSAQLKGDHFGQIRIKGLCDPTGPNKRGGPLFDPCETYGAPKSIQTELAQYVANGIKECVEFDEFSHMLGYDITPGEIDPTVTMTENSVVFNVRYFLTINIKGKAVSKPIDFKTEIPLRLKNIHEYFYLGGQKQGFLQRAANDILFNITRDYENITFGGKSYWLPGFRYSIEKNACTECSDAAGFDTIVSLIDEFSLVNGQPYMFQVAIRNRVPALDWVHYPNPLSDDYDLVIIENSTRQITPKGYDPDQDALSYSYSGWKADYEEKHTFSGNHILITQQTALSENLLHKSDPYLKNMKDVEIHADNGDIGPHNITLTLTDEAGNYDYQIIRILVNDLPLVDLKTDNMFTDITNKKLASIEDPYKLDASGTTSIFNNGLSYIFDDSLEGNIQDSSESIVYVPEIQPDIRTIKQRMFTQTGSHIITLKVTDNFFGAQAIGVKTETIEVKECLAHKNTQTRAYPYNFILDRNDGYENIANPYQADHTCCNPSTSKPYGTEKTCYEYTDYGAWDAQSDAEKYYNTLDTVNKHGIKYLDLSGTETELDVLKSTYPTAVIKRTFKRYCGGDRGNICGGAGELTVQVYEDCGGFTKGAQERCSGPNRNILQKTGPTNSGCENYEGISFEELTGNAPNDGICNTNFRCSSEGNGGNYFDEGAFYCQASCSGGYCSKAINCNCKKGCTGAECDSLNYWLLSGDICEHSCSLATCTYQSSNCPTRAVTTDPNPQSSNLRDHNLGYDEYCHVRSDCKNTGCEMKTPNILRKDYCDSCIANLGVVYGNSCIASEYCNSNCPNSGVFYYNPSCTGVQKTICTMQRCNYKNGYITTAASPQCRCDNNECKMDCQEWLAANHPDWQYFSQVTLCVNSNTACQCGYQTTQSQPPRWTYI